MKKIISAVLLLGLAILFTACTGVSGGVGVYSHHYGHGPWWGGRDYYRDTVVVVPPEEIDPPVEAVPLPSGPEDMPDMGMPDGDIGDIEDFGGDF